LAKIKAELPRRAARRALGLDLLIPRHITLRHAIEFIASGLRSATRSPAAARHGHRTQACRRRWRRRCISRRLPRAVPGAGPRNPDAPPGARPRRARRRRAHRRPARFHPPPRRAGRRERRRRRRGARLLPQRHPGRRRRRRRSGLRQHRARHGEPHARAPGARAHAHARRRRRPPCSCWTEGSVPNRRRRRTGVVGRPGGHEVRRGGRGVLAGDAGELPRRGGHTRAHRQGARLGIRYALLQRPCIPFLAFCFFFFNFNYNSRSELELSTTDLPWLVGDAATQKSRFAFWLRTIERVKTLRCILVNSFPGEAIAAGADQQQPLPQDQQILQVGPLLATIVTDRAKDNSNLRCSPMKTTKNDTSTCQADDRTSCMEWLDQQRPGSVAYVSFGTWVAPIAPGEITELAVGLVATGRPFLWVLKDDPSWRAGLPAGYTDQYSGRGKIVAWAPQEDVLANGAVGCYLTHCGWNSTLEAIRHGVRMLCYPVAGDQFINCAYIVRAWGVGIRLRSADRGEVVDCVRRIMEGEDGRRLREKLDELRERVMAGEALCVAKRNIEEFIRGISGQRLQ
ncbi:hypothetical protein EE612_012571, partial [Oryza sativa]